MINWILGGGIAGLAIYAAVRYLINIKKGKSCCSGCSSCNNSCCAYRKNNT